MNVKTVIELDMETVYDIFNTLQDSASILDKVGIVTVEQAYVIMTADEFHHLKNKANHPSTFALSYDMINELEALNISELETILSIVSSQLNIKMAKQYLSR